MIRGFQLNVLATSVSPKCVRRDGWHNADNSELSLEMTSRYRSRLDRFTYEVLPVHRIRVSTRGMCDFSPSSQPPFVSLVRVTHHLLIRTLVCMYSCTDNNLLPKMSVDAPTISGCRVPEDSQSALSARQNSRLQPHMSEPGKQNSKPLDRQENNKASACLNDKRY